MKEILVIDDDDAVRETICDNLSESGYKVFSANDGEDGLAKIRAGLRPRVVITDIIMPNKEGIETIIEIKRDYPDIKLIAISGGGRTKPEDFLSLAEKLGADIRLPKPLDMDLLIEGVEELLND